MKHLVAIACFFVLLIAPFSATAHAVPAAQVTVLLDGQAVVSDSPAVNVGGRVYLPLRAIGEALGGAVSWDGPNNTAIIAKDGYEIRMTVGQRIYTMDGTQYTMDAAPYNANGRVMVPVRYLSEALGLDVAWDGATSTVTLTPLLPEMPNTVGNTAGNALNSAQGLAAVQGDWIYFANRTDDALYRMRLDGTGLTRLVSDKWIGGINVVGDWVFYMGMDNRQTGIWRVRLNGTGEQLIYDEGTVREMTVAGDWIYFIKYPDDTGVFRMKTDGTARERLCDDTDCTCLNIGAGTIFFESSAPTKTLIRRMNLDGSGLQTLSDNGGRGMVVSDDRILFEHIDNWDEGRFSWRQMDGNGGEVSTLREGSDTYYMNLLDEWLYYTEGGPNGGPLYRTNLRTHETVKLVDGTCVFPNLAGDWVLYQDDPNGGICRVKIDGTGRAKLIDGQWVPQD